MKRVLEAVPAPACLLGADGRVTAVNDRFASLAGSPEGCQSEGSQSNDGGSGESPREPTVEGVDPGSLPADGSAVTRSVAVEGPAGSTEVEATLRRVVDARPGDAALCVLPSVDAGREDPIPTALLSVIEELPVGAFVLREDGSIEAWNSTMPGRTSPTTCER